MLLKHEIGKLSQMIKKLDYFYEIKSYWSKNNK